MQCISSLNDGIVSLCKNRNLFYFSCFANEKVFFFFFKSHHLFICRSQGHFCFFAARVISVLSKPECVYLRVLVKQPATFALPSAAAAGGILKKNKTKKNNNNNTRTHAHTQCERWADSPGRTIAIGLKMLLDY